jgi:hypothetical protein
MLTSNQPWRLNQNKGSAPLVMLVGTVRRSTHDGTFTHKSAPMLGAPKKKPPEGGFQIQTC